MIIIIKLACEHFISKGGYVFEILPKNLDRLCQCRKNIRNLNTQSDSNDSHIQIWMHKNCYLQNEMGAYQMYTFPFIKLFHYFLSYYFPKTKYLTRQKEIKITFSLTIWCTMVSNVIERSFPFIN